MKPLDALTPGERWAFERGFNDYPVFIERGIASYEAGYLAAERQDEHRRETLQGERDLQRECDE